MKHAPHFDLPPALPRGDRAGDGFTANRQSTENTPGLVPTAAKSVEYSPALFQVPVAGFGRSGNALAVSASQAAKASDADALPATGYDFPSSPRGLQNGRQRARIENAPIRTWAHTWDWYLHDVRVSPKARQEAQVLPQQNEQGAIQPAQVIAFPGGQLRQGTVCGVVDAQREAISPNQRWARWPISAESPDGTRPIAASNQSGPQTVKIPAALLTPHHKAGTAGPQTNPPQGGGQLLSLADSSLKYRPATLTAVSANSVMPCGGVDSDTLGSIGTVRDAATLPTGQAGGRYPSQCGGVKPDISDPSRVQFPARMAPVWRFL